MAGMLLLSQAVTAAEPYLRVNRNGVIYYYFPSRGGSRGAAVIEVTKPAASSKSSHKAAARREKAPSPPAATAAAGVTDLGLVAELPEEAPAAQAPKTPGTMLPGSRYLMGLLSKLGYRYPLDSPATANRLQPLERVMDHPSSQVAQVVAPEGWKKILQEAREHGFQWDPVNQGPQGFNDAGLLPYCFPVAWPFSFKDSWGDPRPGGRMHRAIDIFAPEGSAVYAIASGVIDGLSTSASGGISLFLQGQDGRGYGYMHLQAYAPGIVQGRAVRTGEMIGYVGRTGMTTSAAHLHLQVYADHRLCRDELLNPYSFLVQLCHGVGVTDLYEHKIARLENPQTRFNQIQVYRRPGYAALKGGVKQFNTKNSSVLVIKNY